MNSILYIMVEFIMELTNNTNLTTVKDMVEFFAISIWVSNKTKFYVHSIPLVGLIRNLRI